MKLNLLLTLAAVVAFGSMTAQAQSETDFTFGVNQPVPDNNPVGLTLSTNLTVAGGSISSLTVALDISGGFNGDLYAYLTGPNGGFAMLLNRVGVSNTASQFGYADPGFEVTFDDTAADSIQYYQNDSPVFNGSGQLTGTWQPEGVTIAPNSPPANFLGAPQSAMLDSFDGTDPNGTWTLFLADLSAGGQSTVVNWNLDITTVPEPSELMLLGVGLAGVVLLFRRRKQTK